MKLYLDTISLKKKGDEIISWYHFIEVKGIDIIYMSFP
jgi:hypothetical protein